MHNYMHGHDELQGLGYQWSTHCGWIGHPVSFYHSQLKQILLSYYSGEIVSDLMVLFPLMQSSWSEADTGRAILNTKSTKILVA